MFNETETLEKDLHTFALLDKISSMGEAISKLQNWPRLALKVKQPSKLANDSNFMAEVSNLNRR